MVSGIARLLAVAVAAVLLSVAPAAADDTTSEKTTAPSLQPFRALDERPNIVVVMADDMRADELRYMPRTRRLLQRQGLEFANSFSPLPLCCPARSSFITGRYTHNHGVWANAGAYGFDALDDSDTLATRLHDVGYNTAFVGKYLNGYGTQDLADGSSSLRYVPPGWTDWRGAVGWPKGVDHPDRGQTYHYRDTTLNINGTLRGNEGRYQTGLLGAESRQAIARLTRSPRPFFLWASYVAPHTGAPRERDDPRIIDRGGSLLRIGTPARPPRVRGMFDDVITRAPGADGERDVGDKPFFIRQQPRLQEEERRGLLAHARQRAESLWVLDEQVEQTVQALSRAGELDNTIVAFTSDNGYFLGEHRLRRNKRLPYEPSLRVPAVMRGPGIPAGAVRTDPFLTMDFAPSFLEVAGARPDPAADGMPMLDDAGADRPWTRAVVTDTGPRPVDYDEDEGVLPLPGVKAVRFSVGLRTPRYLYVEHASDERELYDLRRDPGQVDSLVGSPAARALERRLARVLQRMRDCAADECHAPLPPSLR